ncbi:E3 ubiquitin-protein ligase TRIM8b [Denticeps clupeoides]|uniref:RING-type domain-containing protein n=1 Tax=Denticeps clupeoides TaxID=299321 RepID=A0AAY4B1D5_9TELE|nr:probable E3 ubiquitin-protein ligase TRIM8 [Denticeps clupeoides]
MAESWKNLFEEELICPICLHVFSEPIQLPCKHNFCRGCINEAWSKDAGVVRCPECNHAYSQKPTLEKNHKLSNIVEKFNALNVEKPSSVLHCILCRRGPPLPAQKVCLRCNAPCCQSHVQTHLQQPSSNPGHLLVQVEDVRAWSCPQHDEYRLFHCETEQVAVCQYCCFSRCAASHAHAMCDIDIRRNDIRQMLMKQQERLEDRSQEIEEQLCKLDTDKCLVENKVERLRQEVQLQYQKMQQLLEEDLGKTLAVLDKAHARFCQENSAQSLQLKHRQHEAQKLLQSAQVLFDKAEDINFMKNTKSVKILMERSQSCVGTALPTHKVGSVSSKLFLAEVSKKEKGLRKMLEVPFSAPASFLQSVPAYYCGLNSSGGEKRKHSSAFPEGSGSSRDPSSSSSSSSSSSGSAAKQPYLGATAPETQSSQQGGPGPCGASQHGGGASSGGGGGSGGASQPLHHTSSVFSSSHYPGGGGGTSSQQAILPQYGGRKILMCTVDNCYCAGVPSVSSHRPHPPYSRTGSFPWAVSAQDYPTALPPSTGMPVRDWIEASQTHRHPDFYGLYGQTSAKHYVTS